MAVMGHNIKFWVEQYSASILMQQLAANRQLLITQQGILTMAVWELQHLRSPCMHSSHLTHIMVIKNIFSQLFSILKSFIEAMFCEFRG